MKIILLTIISFCAVNFAFSEDTISGDQKQRIIILADMGNEPDEEQQMMHMLMYCNEFDLEGLIAVTGKYLNPGSWEPYKRVLHPELFLELIDGYSKVYENLVKHSGGYPHPTFLKSIVVPGQPGYGIGDIGEGKSTAGSELIINSVTKTDPRPVYIIVNAGSNTLAQALFDYRKNHTSDEVALFVSKLRVFENGAQDNAGAFICANYPEINWIRSNYQTYCFGGPGTDGEADNSGKINNLGPYTWEPYSYSDVGQNQWALEHIIGNHGAFGCYYPVRQFGDGRVLFIEGGGTIPWLGLVNKGLYDIEHPYWGGWSGRFSRTKHLNYFSKHSDIKIDEEKVAPFYVFIEEPDTWINPENGDKYNNIFAPVWRWRRAFFNDFKCRMDWCVLPYVNANHNPVAAINGDKTNTIIIKQALPGDKFIFDASESYDPDGDFLNFRWFYYPEAGTFQSNIEIILSKPEIAEIAIPADAGGKEIHVILEVMDRNKIGSLFDYRRIVFNINKE